MGEVFAGRYELADPIGRGGVGAVWRAWDHRRRRYVAAKVLQQSDAHALLRFVREQALRIDHPHLLAPASWAADDDKVLFTMDLVAGGSLVHLVGDYGPLPPAFVCTLLDQLLSGLAAVHAEGVVHRDIKPANVLLEATGTNRPRLRLSDFGIAMRLGEPRLTETNLVVGTPGYLAPEQMMGAEPDFPADLFAVGLTALYLLEGAKPDAKALIQYFTAHGTPRAPQGIPEPLWQVVASLLQPDPHARFRTATGARKALSSAAELLHEPGPDDEIIEIFDQLGPLPSGFAASGPLRRAAGVETGTGTGTGTFRWPGDGASPSAGDAWLVERAAGVGEDAWAEGGSGALTPGEGASVRPVAGASSLPEQASQGLGAPVSPEVGHSASAPEDVDSPSGSGGATPAAPQSSPTHSQPGWGSSDAAPDTGSIAAQPGSVAVPPASRSAQPRSGQAPSTTAAGSAPLSETSGARPASPAAGAVFPDPRQGTGSASAPIGAPCSPPAVAPVPPTAPPQPSTPAQPLTMSDTGSFHLPPPQTTSAFSLQTPASQTHPEHQQPQRHGQPQPQPHPAPPPLHVSDHDPTHVLSSPRSHATSTPHRSPHTPTTGGHQRAEPSTASYTAQDPQVPPPAQAFSQPRHRAARSARRAGPPAKVAIPLLLLALACYAVGFWALTQI